MNMKKPFLFVFGTRPEAIKLLPLVWEFQKRKIPYEILHTNQHAELLDDLLQKHKILPDFRLSVFGLTSSILETKLEILSQMEDTLDANRFSAVIVQGDTLSALCGAEYGFLRELPVVHIEAGMRTYSACNPYPEEIFRRMISSTATLHFCPSADEARNLRGEGIPSDSIFVVGNTFADYWQSLTMPAVPQRKQILVTIHRRENLPFLEKIFEALAELTQRLCDYEFLFPLHPNPSIVSCAEAKLCALPNLKLTPPLPPKAFYRELLASEMVFTDSGGVQEECILLAKKVLVVRGVSERRTDFDFSALVAPEDPTLTEKFTALLAKRVTATHCDYYGNGGAAEKIAEILERKI